MNKQTIIAVVASVLLTVLLLAGYHYVSQHLRWVPSPSVPVTPVTPVNPDPKKPVWPTVSFRIVEGAVRA